MRTFTEPEVLTDHSRLQEIYDLRVFCWENSPGKEDINSVKFPNGYSDHLEDRSIHIISKDSEDKIIGAARLTICNSLEELPYPWVFKVYEHLLPAERPFLFYSRLVIHPDFRKTGLRKLFDDLRAKKHLELEIPFGIVRIRPKRLLQILPYGWRKLERPLIENDPSYAFADETALSLLTLKDLKI